MTLPASWLDELKGRATLLDIVRRRDKLVKSGAEWSGLCPFHNEKSPSFTVNERKGFFHCFGCGAHGDAIAFVMRSSNLTFVDAVTDIAAELGMDVPQEKPDDPEVTRRRTGLRDVLEWAAQWFQARLTDHAGASARDYLVKRGVSSESVTQWRLGYAPGGSDALRRAALDHGFGEAALFDAGLIRRRAESGDVVDLLRHRLVFPIFDGRGAVVAFGGRALGESKAKYINSPQTDLFDKSGTLYGMPFARDGAGRSGQVVVVEGYLDVIAAHQAGFNYAVAPLGTALTEQHLDLLWRMAPAPTLCLDGDAAGAKAMTRAARLALGHLTAGRGLRFAQLPHPDDPDSLIKREGGESFTRVIQAAFPLSEAIWVSAKHEFPPETPEQTAALETELYQLASTVPDDLIRAQILGDWRARLRTGWDETEDRILVGRSTKETAPRAADPLLEGLFSRAVDAAQSSPVPDWLAKNGVSLDAVRERLGGIGLVRGRMVKGKPLDRWPDMDRPVLWDEPGTQWLLIVPEWEGEPGDSALLDLVAFDPRTGALASRTAWCAVLGHRAVHTARGFEARGLSQSVLVAESPLSWLRAVSSGRDPVLVLDWSRAWHVLGGLSRLVADTVENGEKLEKFVRPRMRLPKIMVETSNA